MALIYKDIVRESRNNKDYMIPDSANSILFTAIEKMRDNPILNNDDIDKDVLPRVKEYIKYKRFGQMTIVKNGNLIALIKFQNGIFNLATIYSLKKNGFDGIDIFNNKVTWSRKKVENNNQKG